MNVTPNMIDSELRNNLRKDVYFKSTEDLAKKGLFSNRVLRLKHSLILRCRKIKLQREDYSTLLLRTYGPKQAERQDIPCIIWFHGGGFASGCSTMVIPYAEQLNRVCPCLVVAPEYVLSGKKPYPAALKDCYTALEWVLSNAKELGIRKGQVYLGGDSAGGNLAAATALYARNHGMAKLAGLLLMYPMLDDRMDTASMRGNNAPNWDEHSTRIAWQLYLGKLYGQSEVPAYAAPARAESLAEFPPTFLLVGELDPFYDEVCAFAAALKAASIEVELHTYTGCFHGFDQVAPKAQKSQNAMNDLRGAFQKMLQKQNENS